MKEKMKDNKAIVARCTLGRKLPSEIAVTTSSIKSHTRKKDLRDKKTKLL
jgi:hypothetical protein